MTDHDHDHDELDWEPPPFSMDVNAPTGIRRGEVLSVSGRKVLVGKLDGGGRRLTLEGERTTVTVYLRSDLAARLKEAL